MIRKAVYYFQNSNTVLFQDEIKEEWEDNFEGWMDLTEEQILYGEFRKNPLPHITLESQKYYIYQATDVEYNRKRVYKMLHDRRDEVLGFDFKIPFVYDGRNFDGNGRAKENIKGLYDALRDVPSEQRESYFPILWRDYENQNYEFGSWLDYSLFFISFSFFRLDYEKSANQKTFELKDLLIGAETLEQVRAIEGRVLEIGPG